MTLLLLLGLARAADDPAELAALAVQANPGIEALRDQVRRLDALAEVADIWPDPVAGLELSNLPAGDWTLDGHPMAGLQARLALPVPFPGTTSMRREVAEARTEVARRAVEEGELQLRSRVEGVYWLLALERAQREVTRRHVEIAEELVVAVRARYETGTAAQSSLLNLEVLRDQLRDDLGDHDRNERRLLAALDAALHRAPDAPVDTRELGEALPVPGEPGEWLDVARQHRPLLEELEQRAVTSELEARLAVVEARPDLTLQAGWRTRTYISDMDPGTDLASVGVSVPIAFNSARRARGQQAGALHEAELARQRRDQAIDRIAAELESIHAAWVRAHEKAETYQGSLLPAARLALDATLSDYRVDRADFSTLYEAELRLLKLDRATLDALAATRIAASDARAAAGGPLNGANQ